MQRIPAIISGHPQVAHFVLSSIGGRFSIHCRCKARRPESSRNTAERMLLSKRGQGFYGVRSIRTTPLWSDLSHNN